MNHIWSASYARGRRLVREGCPLPYLSTLPGRERFYQRGLYVYQVGGYIESYAIDCGTSTGYAIALGVGTELSRGAVITSCSVVPPWTGHEIDWNYDPEDVLPKSKLQEYSKLLDSRLPGVLNDRKLLYRGCPIEGLLSGRAWAPIPASFPREKPAKAEIILVSDSGFCVRAPIWLTIYSAIRQEYGMSGSGVSRDLEITKKSA